MKTLNSFLCRTCDKFYDVSCSMLTSMCWKRRPGWSTCLSWWDRRLKTAAWPSHKSSSMVLNTEQNLSRQRTISSTWLKESCEEAKEEVHVQTQAPPERMAQNHLPKEQQGEGEGVSFPLSSSPAQRLRKLISSCPLLLDTAEGWSYTDDVTNLPVKLCFGGCWTHCSVPGMHFCFANYPKQLVRDKFKKSDEHWFMEENWRGKNEGKPLRSLHIHVLIHCCCWKASIRAAMATLQQALFIWKCKLIIIDAGVMKMGVCATHTSAAIWSRFCQQGNKNKLINQSNQHF